VHAPWQRRLEALLAPVVRVAPERLRLAASHDLALADWVEHGRRIRFELFWRGSEEALAELGRDECEMAGFHVPESWTVAQLENWLGRWLDPARHVCLPVMRRSQGLIVARGNPHRVQTLADVSRRGLRLVNRQRGSGYAQPDRPVAGGQWPEAREHRRLPPRGIHPRGVAATIAAGQADVGFGIEAAAARYDLGFVPLVSERYGFAMPNTIAASPEGKAFLARLQGNTFRQRLLAMPGYQPLAVRAPGAWAEFLA
jgi:molybdate-binding protein